MKNLTFLLLLLLLVVSCSSSKKRDEKKAEAWTEWKGKSIDEIKKHPYFKILPYTKIQNESGIETWIFRDQTKFQTDAYCSSIGGCIGVPSFNCNNVFSVKRNLILDFEQKGSCPGVKTIKAP